MKKALTLALTLCLILSLFAGMGGTASADGKKTMVIGDTTFNAENWAARRWFTTPTPWSWSPGWHSPGKTTAI